MADHGKRSGGQPLYSEWLILIIIGTFFAFAAALYGWWSHSYYGAIEPIGTVGLGLIVGMFYLSGGYLFKLSREIETRPEDDPYAEQDEGAGEYGHFAPWSWWPLVCGFAVALIFLGPALHAWWLTGIGAVLGAIGVGGHVLEFNRGPHAH